MFDLPDSIEVGTTLTLSDYVSLTGALKDYELLFFALGGAQLPPGVDLRIDDDVLTVNAGVGAMIEVVAQVVGVVGFLGEDSDTILIVDR